MLANQPPVAWGGSYRCRRITNTTRLPPPVWLIRWQVRAANVEVRTADGASSRKRSMWCQIARQRGTSGNLEAEEHAESLCFGPHSSHSDLSTSHESPRFRGITCRLPRMPGPSLRPHGCGNFGQFRSY